MTSLQRRVWTAVGFIPLLIGAAHLGGLVFFLFFLTIMIGASWEFYKLMAAKGVQPSTKTGMFFSIVLMSLTFFTGTEHLDVFLAAFMIWITLRELFRPTITFPIYDIAVTLLGVLYIGWLFCFVVLLREMPGEIGMRYEIGRSFVLYPILMAWGCDTSAYFFGKAFGKDKLIPRVSPGKSVQGAVAGFTAAVVMAFVGRWWFFHDAAGQPLLGIS
ncbi:MAG: phosphatidate cytidylyltransferase, partial [Gemmatimonadetes bacterium]|nr:phosphatidate cytidylyltransferase [Gemmatimonadota bacterium]